MTQLIQHAFPPHGSWRFRSRCSRLFSRDLLSGILQLDYPTRIIKICVDNVSPYVLYYIVRAGNADIPKVAE